MENKIRRAKLEILSDYIVLVSTERYVRHSMEVDDSATFLKQLEAKLDILEKDY